MRLLFLASTLLSAGLVLAACSGSDGADTSPSAGGSSGGSSTPGAAECAQRCETTLNGCNPGGALAKERCGRLCQPGPTLDQLLCFDARSCSQVAVAERIDDICPDASFLNKVDLGAGCQCEGSSPGGEGMCGGASTACKLHLSCLYEEGSNGQGTCVGKACCDDEEACDEDPALLKPCNGVGTCQKGSQGYFCRP